MADDRFIGVLEREMSHGVRGWVIDRQSLDASLEVEISFDDFYFCRTIARIPRKNLSRGAQGRYGFEVKLLDLPVALFEQPITAVRAVTVQHHFELLNSPLCFDRVGVARSVSALMHKDINTVLNSPRL